MCPRRPAGGGFTLVELLAVLAIVAVLMMVLAPVIQAAQRKAQSAECLSKMKNLGAGILLHAQDTGEFPRSLHSAAGAGVRPWAKSILPYLDQPANPSAAQWESLFAKLYTCPANPKKDPSIHSYALNVFFELDPGGDDYGGSPARWRRPGNLPRPAATILLAEPRAVHFADHIMSHQWTGGSGASNAVDSKRHAGRSHYLFCDGHVRALEVEETFDPGAGVNLWNPIEAGAR